MIDKQEYIKYLHTLFVASYIIKPSLTNSIEDELEAIAIHKGQDREQAKADVKHILNLKKAITKFLKKITEEKYQISTINKK